MLTLDDCIAFSGLTPDQLDAIATRRHLPPVLAAEWAETMLATEDGTRLVEAILVEEMACACAHGDEDWACRCRAGVDAFVRDHPH